MEFIMPKYVLARTSSVNSSGEINPGSVQWEICVYRDWLQDHRFLRHEGSQHNLEGKTLEEVAKSVQNICPMTENDLVTTTPTEGATGSRTPEINDAIREIKSCLKTTMAVEHSLTTGMHLINRAAKTTTYAILTTDTDIDCDATTAGFTVTVPTAVGYEGKYYTVKKVDSTANVVTIAFTGAETCDGSSTLSLSSQWQAVGMRSNGATWVKWMDSAWVDVASATKYSTYACPGVELAAGDYVAFGRQTVAATKTLHVRTLGIIQTDGTASPAGVIAEVYNITDDVTVTSTIYDYTTVTGVSVAAGKELVFRLYNGGSDVYNLTGFVTAEVL